MGVRGKTLVTVLLVGVVAGAYTLQTNNSALFKGQLTTNPVEDAENSVALPDLKADLEVLPPLDGNEDLRASATISNVGEGPVQKGQPFKYVIYINGEEVFSNTDSYSSVEPGDSFNFVYPIPKTIYQYPDSGTVKFVLDSDNSIEENNEGNNEAEVAY